MSLLSYEAFAGLEGSGLTAKQGKHIENRSRKARRDTDTLHEALGNSILGNPIDENTIHDFYSLVGVR